MLHDAGVWFEHRAVLAVHEANGVQRQEEAALLFSFYHLAAGLRKKKKKKIRTSADCSLNACFRKDRGSAPRA